MPNFLAHHPGSRAKRLGRQDRIMCLQVYIKETTGYTVTYIPDAKAFTDGPPSMMVLMK